MFVNQKSLKMKLKRYLLFLLLAFITLSFVSCVGVERHKYTINAKNAICTRVEQKVVIEYAVHSDIMESNLRVNAECSESWVSVVDSSVKGKIYLSVEQNHGDTRTANITISARNCVPATVTLMQYGMPPAEANHTLMFCFLGTSLSRYFKTNLEDAALAIQTGILANKNRVVFFRQESATAGYIGELCHNVNGGECIELRIKEISLDKSTISPETIGDILAQMAEVAPAKRYGVVFAGHGQGWITREALNSDKGIEKFGVSYNPWLVAEGAEQTRAFGENNVQLNIDELAMGIESSGVGFDYILFDACFMSNIEAIYDLRNSANYIIASPCEIMGRGFPYHRTLPYLFTDYGESTDYNGAARSYHEYYKNEYVGNGRCGSITVYKCSEIEALADAVRGVMVSAKKSTEYDSSTLQTYEGQRYHQFYDFGEWVNVVATNSEALDRFNAQMKECVVATYTLETFYSAYGTYGTYPINLDVYSGVTTSAPSDAYTGEWKTTNWYKEVIALEN